MKIDKRLLYVNPDGSEVYHYWDEENKKGAFEIKTDTQPLLDMNQAAKNNESGNWSGDMHHVASIDPVVWGNWSKECGGNPLAPENRAWLFKRLNDRDYSKFRVKSGRL